MLYNLLFTSIDKRWQFIKNNRTASLFARNILWIS